jgi:hypothetical protein
LILNVEGALGVVGGELCGFHVDTTPLIVVILVFEDEFILWVMVFDLFDEILFDLVD